MSYDLKGKKAVVLGGSGLIGSAIVRGFCSCGADVTNVDINMGDIVLDMHQPYAYDCLKATIDWWHILVDCTYPTHPMESGSWIYFINKAVSGMLQGSVILFSSIYAQRGPDKSIYEDNDVKLPELWYSFFKGGVESATRWLACMYPNIRCNCIAPGGIWDHHNQKFEQNYSNKTPLGRMGLPDDITGLVLFLASNESQYLTGQIINIDGGITSKI